MESDKFMPAYWINKSIDVICSNSAYRYLLGDAALELIVDRYFATNLANGIGVVFDHDKIAVSMHLYREYPGMLPHNLRFDMSQREIETLLGAEDRSGGGFSNDLMGPVPLWKKYYFDAYSVHVQFSLERQLVDLITVSSLDLEPHFAGK